MSGPSGWQGCSILVSIRYTYRVQVLETRNNRAKKEDHVFGPLVALEYLIQIYHGINNHIILLFSLLSADPR